MVRCMSCQQLQTGKIVGETTVCGRISTFKTTSGFKGQTLSHCMEVDVKGLKPPMADQAEGRPKSR